MHFRHRLRSAASFPSWSQSPELWSLCCIQGLRPRQGKLWILAEVVQMGETRCPKPLFLGLWDCINAGISAGEFTSPPWPGFSWKLILCRGTWKTSIQNYFYRVWAALEVPSQRERPSPLAVELFDGGTSLGWGMELERAQSPPVPLAPPEEAPARSCGARGHQIISQLLNEF